MKSAWDHISEAGAALQSAAVEIHLMRAELQLPGSADGDAEGWIEELDFELTDLSNRLREAVLNASLALAEAFFSEGRE